MPTYSRPDVYIEEVTQLEGPIVPVELGYGALMGITERGPLRTVVRTNSFEEWKKVFGNRESRSDMAYEAEAFFREGGVELLTVRLGNYTNIDDSTSYSGVAANRTSITDGVAATPATKTGGAQNYNLEPGWDVDLDVDNVGVATATWDAARAVIAGGAPALPPDAGDTVVLKCDKDPDNQTVTWAGTENTVALAIAAIHAQTSGITAVDNAGNIDLYSDTYGTDSTLQVVSETGGSGGAAHIGHSPGAAVIGTGDVADIDRVTATEIKTIIEADTTALVTVNPAGNFTITSPTTGLTSELDFQSGTALTALGLSVETITGTAAGATYSTLKMEAGYLGQVSPGTWGNNLKTKITQNPRHASAGAGSDIAVDITAADTSVQVVSLAGINVDSVIKVTDGTNTEYKQVTAVRTVIAAGAATFFVDISGSFSNSYVVGVTTLQTQEFDLHIYENDVEVEVDRWVQMSMLDTADNYVETLMNDESTGSFYIKVTDLDAAIGLGADLPATDTAGVALTSGANEATGMTDVDWIGSETGGTGLYALNNNIEFMPFAIVGNNNAAVVHAAANYAASKIYLEFITYCTAGLTAAQAVAYRETTLGIDSSYVSLYAGGIKVFDVAGAGSSPKRSIAGVGAVMGLRARVDNLASPNGGPWQSPAGEGSYGRINYALNAVTEYDDAAHALLNDAHINTIRQYGNVGPVLVMGARTLDSSVSQKWRYINVRRMFQFIEKSIADNTRWAILRNNDFRLWAKLKDRVEEFLESLAPQNAFPSETASDSYFVKMGTDDGTMVQADIDAGRVIGEVGIAPQKPGEFIIWRFTQMESGTTISEA